MEGMALLATKVPKAAIPVPANSARSNSRPIKRCPRTGHGLGHQQFQIDWRVMFSPTISMCVGGLGRDQLDGWVKVVVSRRL
jgi:hypothetical protein